MDKIINKIYMKYIGMNFFICNIKFCNNFQYYFGNIYYSKFYVFAEFNYKIINNIYYPI